MSSGILDNAAVAQALQELPGWQRTGDGITRTFVHDDFRSAMTFVDRVADAAEAANHHPDIDIRWNKVTLTLTTHSADRFISNDTILGHRIQRLVRDHHHPPGMAGRDINRGGQASAAGAARPGDSAPIRPRRRP